eukprot:339884-Chlamydomonas_euryale.AAC.1
MKSCISPNTNATVLPSVCQPPHPPHPTGACAWLPPAPRRSTQHALSPPNTAHTSHTSHTCLCRERVPLRLRRARVCAGASRLCCCLPFCRCRLPFCRRRLPPRCGALSLRGSRLERLNCRLERLNCRLPARQPLRCTLVPLLSGALRVAKRARRVLRHLLGERLWRCRVCGWAAWLV